MRIVSLLPSLTEIVCQLGRQADLVGVTHECDFPIGIERLPHLTHSRIPIAATSAEIDQAVKSEGGSLYDLDADLLASLKPDLILTQEQCDVCAVNEKTVRKVAATLPGSPHVESVNPLDLDGVYAVIDRVADLLGVSDLAQTLRADFQAFADEIEQRVAGRGRPRVLLLEWFDPPFSAGHWNPELVRLAGGLEVIGQTGKRSTQVTWQAIAEANPDVILLSPCGFAIDRGLAELKALAAFEPWLQLSAVKAGKVALTDGSAYFSRPGPRLKESLAIAAAVIHPDLCADLAPQVSVHWIGTP
jgi:iron complex transport system substrate-binding protein